MDAKPNGRFVTGHSSGGWAALWLQVNYPKLFGGAWPTSPDPSDFHNFLGIDLYAQGANVYRKPDGSPWPLAQDKGQMLVSIEDYTRREVVVGAYGGQLASFEWVFSPRGADGLPVPLFDRTTGAVDSSVMSYWKDYYDVAEQLRRHWPELKRDLDGKIHLTVGSADTFYLDGSAHLLEATMKELGARTDFRYVEGRGHFDLYRVGDDPSGLYKALAWEMYAVARPGSKPPRVATRRPPLVAGLAPPFECLQCISTSVRRCGDPVDWLAEARTNARKRGWEAVATARQSKYECGSRMPGQRYEERLGSTRDVQETLPDLAVRATRVDKYADDRPLCLQKVDDLRLGRHRRSAAVRPDREVEPGDGLLQRARLRSIMTDGDRHDVARKVTESADAIQLVGVPGEAHNRPRSLLEQSHQLGRIRLPANSSCAPSGVQAAGECEIGSVDHGLQEDIERVTPVRCL